MVAVKLGKSVDWKKWSIKYQSHSKFIHKGVVVEQEDVG